MISATRQVLSAALFGGLVLTGTLSPAAWAEEITITHAQGETTINGKPETVIVTDWAAFDNLNALGVPVAGIPATNAPKYLEAKLPADALKVGSLQEPDIEGIAAAAPDLVIVASRSRRSYPTLATIAPTVDFSIDNNALIEGVEARITQYGDIFGLQDRAAELIASLNAKLDEARAAVKDKGNALVIVTNGNKLGIYGPESRVSWVYNELGIPSVFETVDDRDHGGNAISFEYLLEKNPDWLIVVDRDAGVGNEGGAEALLDNDLVHQTNAWKNKKILYIDPQAAYVTMHGYQALMLMLDQVIAAYGAAS
ncbi:MAG: siderophore ABC transporter substrate-binding protein [Pseudorhodobacter sp.]